MSLKEAILFRELREALTNSVWEIENLRKKLLNKEDEGWEGTRRRDVLIPKIENLLDRTKTELLKSMDGDGI